MQSLYCKSYKVQKVAYNIADEKKYLDPANCNITLVKEISKIKKGSLLLVKNRAHLKVVLFLCQCITRQHHQHYSKTCQFALQRLHFDVRR